MLFTVAFGTLSCVRGGSSIEI